MIFLNLFAFAVSASLSSHDLRYLAVANHADVGANCLSIRTRIIADKSARPLLPSPKGGKHQLCH